MTCNESYSKRQGESTAMKVESPAERLSTASPRRLVGFVTNIFAAILLAPILAAASGVHPLFKLHSTTQSPFPTDRSTLRDVRQTTRLRVNLPLPNCTARPSDCLDVALLNQLDGFNTQPRISIPFDGAIDPFTVTSQTVFLVRVGNLSDPDDFPPQGIGINQVVWDLATLTLFVESDQH